MLDRLLNGDLIGVLILAVSLVIAISVHEFGHALAAEAQGDHTAKMAGRLTLNPLKHLDPVGSVMMVLAGFGWGKPVPFNPRALSNRRFGAAIVAIAGPITNVILAFAGALAFKSLHPASNSTATEFLFTFIHLNVLLAVFNMIPIPPLDGSRILGAALPPEKQHIVYFLDKWGFVLLFVLVFFLFQPVLGPVIKVLTIKVLTLVGV